MRNAQSAQRRSESTRNRHNGRMNADKAWVLNSEGTEDVTFSDGTKYRVLTFPYKYQEMNEKGELETKTWFKTRYINLTRMERNGTPY